MTNKVWIPVEELTPELSEIGIDFHKLSKVVKVKRLLGAYEEKSDKFDEGYYTEIDTWNNIAGNKIWVTHWQPK